MAALVFLLHFTSSVTWTELLPQQLPNSGGLSSDLHYLLWSDISLIRLQPKTLCLARQQEVVLDPDTHSYCSHHQHYWYRQCCKLKSCYSSTQHLFGQTGAIMTSRSSSGHSFSSTCLMSLRLFSTPFSFIFSTRLWKEQICFPLHFLEHKHLPSVFHLKQGGWTGKVLLFSLPFSPLYSMRSRSKWVITRADKGLESRQCL